MENDKTTVPIKSWDELYAEVSDLIRPKVVQNDHSVLYEIKHTHEGKVFLKEGIDMLMQRNDLEENSVEYNYKKNIHMKEWYEENLIDYNYEKKDYANYGNNTKNTNMTNDYMLSQSLEELERKKPYSSSTLSKRSRESYSASQVRELETFFRTNKYPTSVHKQDLAVKLETTEIRVKTWFQNRRQKLKKVTDPKMYETHCIDESAYELKSISNNSNFMNSAASYSSQFMPSYNYNAGHYNNYIDQC